MKIQSKMTKWFYRFLILIALILLLDYIRVEIINYKISQEIAISPSSLDVLSDEKLKNTLQAAKSNDMDAVMNLVSHYGAVGSESEEPEEAAAMKDHDYWMKVLEDAARAGNQQAKNHFLDGSPD